MDRGCSGGRHRGTGEQQQQEQRVPHCGEGCRGQSPDPRQSCLSSLTQVLSFVQATLPAPHQTHFPLPFPFTPTPLHVSGARASSQAPAPLGFASNTDLIPFLPPHSYPDIISHLLPRPTPPSVPRLYARPQSRHRTLRLGAVHELLNPNSSGLEPNRDTWSVE